MVSRKRSLRLIGTALPPATSLSPAHVKVADRNSNKLRELRAAFDAEAARNHMLPVSNSAQKDLLPENRPEIGTEAGRYTFYPSHHRFGRGVFPGINNRSGAIEAELDAPAGEVTVRFTVDGPGFGKGGSLSLRIDGKEVATGRLNESAPIRFSEEDARIGWDSGTPLTDDYRVPFAASSLRSMAIELGPLQRPRVDSPSGN